MHVVGHFSLCDKITTPANKYLRIRIDKPISQKAIKTVD
jgi:hypothetical protein